MACSRRLFQVRFKFDYSIYLDMILMCHSSNQSPLALNAFGRLCAFQRTVTHRAGGSLKGVTMELQDLTGKTFGRLTVLRLAHTEPGNGRFWVCSCTCGKECLRPTRVLNDTSHSNKSCGCARKEALAKAAKLGHIAITKYTHPLKKKIKDMRQNMIKRCHVPGTRRYERYGGRGITVCEEWRNSPEAFYKWAVENEIESHLSIERINSNGNYEPGNCRLATAVEQANNTSRNKFITFNGETLTVAQWATKLGWQPGVIWHRIQRDWTIEEMLTVPPRQW